MRNYSRREMTETVLHYYNSVTTIIINFERITQQNYLFK